MTLVTSRYVIKVSTIFVFFPSGFIFGFGLSIFLLALDAEFHSSSNGTSFHMSCHSKSAHWSSDTTFSKVISPSKSDPYSFSRLGFSSNHLGWTQNEILHSTQVQKQLQTEKHDCVANFTYAILSLNSIE